MKNFLLHEPSVFLSLLAKLQEGVVIHNKDTAIVYANPSASVILGLSEEELLGQTATSSEWYFVDENYQKIDICDYPVNSLFKYNESIHNMLLGIHRPFKTTTWVDVSGSITQDDQGDKIALIVFTDVTARKEAYDRAELFMRVIESVDTGITITDPNQHDNPMIYTNEAFSNITGYSKEEVLGKNCRFLQAEDTAQEAITTIRHAIENADSAEVLLRNYTKEGKLFYNLLNISPIFDKNKLKYFVGVQHNVTKQQEQETLLREKSLYINSILNEQEGIVIVSDGIKPIYANQALLNFFAVACVEEFIEKYVSICDVCQKNGNKIFTGSAAEIMKLLLQDEHQVKLRDYTGDAHYFTLHVKQIFDERYLFTLYDITPSIKRNKLLEDKAYRDGLTQLFNRQYFYEYFAQEKGKNEKLWGVIITDIDNFKSINDTYGHAKGDEVLQALAQKLKSTLRLSDWIVRWGGEEFVIFVDKCENKEEIKRVAEKLRQAIEAITVPDVRSFTNSLGATLLHGDENIDTAIARADKALYMAKTNGKNRVEIL